MRRSFIWESQYFELDTFLEPQSLFGISTLSLETNDDSAGPPKLPFFRIKREGDIDIMMALADT